MEFVDKKLIEQIVQEVMQRLIDKRRPLLIYPVTFDNHEKETETFGENMGCIFHSHRQHCIGARFKL